MARFRLDSIGELARQLGFTPLETRQAQLAAAERLLLDLDPAKAYPLDFIIFRITAYRPKRVKSDLLAGLALQHDLGLLIERVSLTLDLQTRQIPEPVLAIEDVAGRFSVAGKTIQRWRRRGLAARIFTFPDGKRRVGFLLSTVERFFASRRDQVLAVGNFSPITEKETGQIVRRARRLAGSCWPAEIARRVGRPLHRSPLAIMHVLRKYDSENPASAILPHAAAPITPEDRAQIVRASRRGLAPIQAARRWNRPRSAIYRVIIEDRIHRLTRRRVRFIDDPLYHQPDAADVIAQISAQGDVMNDARAEEARVPRDLPAYFRELYRTPLLSPPRERALFLELNFHKYNFVLARRRLDPLSAGRREVEHLEELRRRIATARDAIVTANLRLVVSVARKHMRPGLSLMELISDGNLTLMRAVECFDFHKGNRFSTYATLALLKGFARSVSRMLADGRGAIRSDAMLAAVADRREAGAVDQILHREQVGRLMLQLTDRERDVLAAHYGIGHAAPATFQQVGQRLGLSKHRVRQIEVAALAKLRVVSA